MSLSIYIATLSSKDDLMSSDPVEAILVIAESAEQAQTSAATFREWMQSVIDVGRLGKYEPGIEGHALLMLLSSKHKSGAIAMIETLA